VGDAKFNDIFWRFKIPLERDTKDAPVEKDITYTVRQLAIYFLSDVSLGGILLI
jgi:hypothetical protein